MALMQGFLLMHDFFMVNKFNFRLELDVTLRAGVIITLDLSLLQTLK